MSEYRDECSGEEPTVRVEVQPHEKPSIAVVRALETLTGEKGTEIDPLYEYVDPEAIDELFVDTNTATRRGSVRFSFGDIDVRLVDGTIVELRR
ncbi:hypothetical protein D8Y22_09765 [Salinadaptatus halalkaliphilus]|uniref:Halobacterial output domain-containing protein n=1 Tax=Salinadaptatus halalkaliphilus TaxID=2419781 RepID=A0A4S3TL71_9EURY|nr:HalOD1 output domain-containing protein [Salinadaptatus halalkaliphilus]THE64899.1 hypothetical protein D8Y22_09765 [Salinadaptatus halalkaliphilus]